MPRLGMNGRPFTEETIGMAVAIRDLKQHLRETGEIKGYNPGFTQRDRSNSSSRSTGSSGTRSISRRIDPLPDVDLTRR